MRGNWNEETVRLLENWSMWVDNGKKIVSLISPFPAYRMSSRGKRAGNVIPILSIEAEKADRIIGSMVERYRKPLVMYYRWDETTRTDESRARSCNCCVETYRDRVNEAHRMFEALWYGHPVALVRSLA